MSIEVEQLIGNLNSPDSCLRLESLKQLMQKVESGEIERPVRGSDVNNHIHTTYSFSPHSPTKAIWMAYMAGLATAGIMDHDSIGGALEFIEAGKLAGLATTIGVECRADFSKTPLNGKCINNPNQNSIAYITLHGVPHTQIDKVKAFFKPFTECRNIRNRQMIAKLNKLIEKAGIAIDFDKDVVPISNYIEGGSITERHILYALSLKLIGILGRGNDMLAFLKEQLHLNVNRKLEGYLMDTSNPYYEYDLLGLLKSEFGENFYIDATLECPDVKDLISFSKRIGAIAAYAYLGDIGDSVTGDKKTQRFEDSYLDQLLELLSKLGFNAVTYMPSRNTLTQLENLRSLCNRYGFFQISGEDINSPRQSFICEALRNERFSNLFDATWALVGHEMAASKDLGSSMFSGEIIHNHPELAERIRIFKEIGLKHKYC
jgi:hypothetical protein